MTTVTGAAQGVGEPAKDVDAFRAARDRYWAELAALANRGKASIKPKDVVRWSALHRDAAADLAKARRLWPDEAFVDTLEALVAASHVALYGRPPGAAAAVARWLAYDYWRAVRARVRWIGASTALLAVAATAAYVWVRTDPVAGGRLASVGVRRDVLAGEERVPIGAWSPVLAFVGAAAGVVGGGVVLVWVGAVVGAVVALVALDGREADSGLLLATAAPLLTVLVVAAAAGTHAGIAGLRAGVDAWRREIGEGALVVATTIPLLVVGIAIVAFTPATASRDGAIAGAAVAGAWWVAAVRLGREP